jgi:outer membrane protein TolC
MQTTPLVEPAACHEGGMRCAKLGEICGLPLRETAMNSASSSATGFCCQSEIADFNDYGRLWGSRAGGTIVYRQLGRVVILWAAVLGGCQRSGVSRPTADLPQGPTTFAARSAPQGAQPRLASKAGADAKRSSNVRLIAGDDEDAEDSMAPTSLPPAAGPIALSLDDAIEMGLAQNPDLVALRQTEGVSEAALGVAQAYPFNAFVQVRATPYQRNSEGGSGSIYNYVLAQQTIQFAHQQQFREDVAASQLNQVRWNVHNFEILNIAQTARLYFTALYQQGIRQLTRSNAELNEELLRISEQQADAGQITRSDLAIVRMDTRSTRQQAELAEANYQTALLDLRRQLNVALDTPIELTEDLMALRWKPAQDAALSHLGSAADNMNLNLGGRENDRELIKRIADIRPDVMAARADTETASANYRLANASRTPDLLFGPFYQRDDFGTWYAGFQGHLILPAQNAAPLARQRAAEQGLRTVTWQQLQARAEIEAVAAVDRYERARRLVEIARPEMQSDLPAELQRLEAQFKENEVDVLRIFQGRTSLIQNRRASLDLLNELAQATAAVTAMTALFPRALLTAEEPLPPAAP